MKECQRHAPATELDRDFTGHGARNILVTRLTKRDGTFVVPGVSELFSIATTRLMFKTVQSGAAGQVMMEVLS